MFYVEIVDRKTGVAIKRMGPMDARKADRVQDGASINLNHDDYFVRQVNASLFGSDLEEPELEPESGPGPWPE